LDGHDWVHRRPPRAVAPRCSDIQAGLPGTTLPSREKSDGKEVISLGAEMVAGPVEAEELQSVPEESRETQIHISHVEPLRRTRGSGGRLRKGDANAHLAAALTPAPPALPDGRLGGADRMGRRESKSKSPRPRAATYFLLSVIFLAVAVMAGDPVRSLRKEYGKTLRNLYSSSFVDAETGLPYDVIDLTKGSWADNEISGGESNQELRCFWEYFFATGDGRIKEIIKRVTKAYTSVLDPGTGFVGSYNYYTETGELIPSFTDDLTGTGEFAPEVRKRQDPIHGTEAPMWSIFPSAWYLGDRGAIRSLERYAETLLQLNSEQGYVHFHMFYGNAFDRWTAWDWSGDPGRFADASYSVKPSPDAYADINEFNWILPMLGAAIVTESTSLRERIVDRVRVVMDNVLEHENGTGRIRNVYKMDGTEAEYRAGWSGEPNIWTYQSWIRSSYFIYNLTGDRRYLDAVTRFLDAYISTELRNQASIDGREVISFLIFHQYITGEKRFLEAAVNASRRMDRTPEAERDINWAIVKALHYAATGDMRELEKALEVEESIRSKSIRRFAGKRFYLLDSELSRAPLDNWPVQHFRGKPITVLLLAERGNQTRGLVYRNLLTLGWMLPRRDLAPPQGFPSTILLAVILTGAVLIALALSRASSLSGLLRVPRTLRRGGTETATRVGSGRERECKAFQSLDICLRCRHYEVRGGKDWCAKFRENLPMRTEGAIQDPT